MADLNLFRGWTPRPTQRRVLECQKRHIMVGGPVGPGKTAGVLWKIYWLCVNFPRNLFLIGRWVEEHLYETTIPSWKELFPEEEFGHVMRYLGGDKEPYGVEIAARDPADPEKLSWDAKSEIRFVPLSIAKRLPGGQIGGFLVEQAEQVPTAETWANLARRMRRKCIPWANQHGLGTCNYEENIDWIIEMWIDGKIENRPLPDEFRANTEFIEAPASETDANFGDQYRREQLAMLPPLKAKMLIEGIMVRNVGRVYKDWNEDIHVQSFEFSEVAEQRGGLTFILAYDYGMSPDPTAILFMAVDGQERVWIRAEHVLTDTTVKDDEVAGKKGHEAIVREIAERIGFPINRASFPSGWDVFGKQHTRLRIADEWSDDFVWHPANCDVQEGILRVSTLLVTRPKKVDNPEEFDLPLLQMHPECENTRYAMASYRYADDGSGKPARKQTPGIKDTADALRYGCLDAVAPHAPKAEKSSILTPKAYDAITRANRKSGRKWAFWVPVTGGVDPAKRFPKSSGPSYIRPLGR